MNHQDNVRGIAFMETFVRTFASWDDWPEDLVEGFKKKISHGRRKLGIDRRAEFFHGANTPLRHSP